jgi:hypothetical protein
MLLDILSILIEEGCSNNMIRHCLSNLGYTDKEIGKIICAAGIGKEREELKRWAKNNFARQRFYEMRK